MEMWSNQKTKDNILVVSPYISLITVKVNGLISPIKSDEVATWITKQDPPICCHQESHLSSKDKHRLKAKR